MLLASLVIFPFPVQASGDPPTITTDPVPSPTNDYHFDAINTYGYQDYLYDPAATDPEGDTLVWTMETDAGFLSIDSSTGAVTGRPTNETARTDFYVNITVDDGTGSDYQNYTLTVWPWRQVYDDVDEPDGFRLNPVRTMRVWRDILYAGGGDGNTQVMRTTDGTTWTTSLAAPYGAPYGSPLYQLEVYNNELYAATGNTVLRTSDGTTWTDIGAPDGVRSLAVLDGTLYAGERSGGAQLGTRIWTWDGTSWALSIDVSTIDGCGFGNFGIRDLTVWRGNLYAARCQTIYVYDGTSWSIFHFQSFNVNNWFALYGDNVNSGGSIWAWPESNRVYGWDGVQVCGTPPLCGAYLIQTTGEIGQGGYVYLDRLWYASGTSENNRPDKSRIGSWPAAAGVLTNDGTEGVAVCARPGCNHEHSFRGGFRGGGNQEDNRHMWVWSFAQFNDRLYAGGHFEVFELIDAGRPHVDLSTTGYFLDYNHTITTSNAITMGTWPHDVQRLAGMTVTPQTSTIDVRPLYYDSVSTTGVVLDFEIWSASEQTVTVDLDILDSQTDREFIIRNMDADVTVSFTQPAGWSLMFGGDILIVDLDTGDRVAFEEVGESFQFTLSSDYRISFSSTTAGGGGGGGRPPVVLPPEEPSIWWEDIPDWWLLFLGIFVVVLLSVVARKKRK